MAFWLNAYNALVLKTVVDQLSDSGSASRRTGRRHPADSGAFEQRRHRAAGRAGHARRVEKAILPSSRNRACILRSAVGAVGSGRLRSEA